MVMVRATVLIMMYHRPNNVKSTTCSLWSRRIRPNLYILLSNLLYLLSKSSDHYAAGLFTTPSYFLCLLSIAYCSEFACLMSVLSPFLSYVSPLMNFLTPQPGPSSSQDHGSGCSKIQHTRIFKLRPRHRHGGKFVAYCLMVCGLKSEVYSSEKWWMMPYVLVLWCKS